MVLNVCECGFANPAEAERCALCGAALEPVQPAQAGSFLVLVPAGGDDAAAVTIPAPGGIIGRSGDFSPEAFSARVSGIHANVSATDAGWDIEHLGRNRSAILRAGVWIELPKGVRVGLLDGDQLRLADMLFCVTITDAGACSEDESAGQTEESPKETGAARAPAERWVIACPVCGSVYEADGRDARISTCDRCFDALDKKRIASVAAKREPVPPVAGR